MGSRFTVAYHFENAVKAAGERCHPNRMKRLAQEVATLTTSLPLSLSSSVFVRCDTDRLDIMKVRFFSLSRNACKSNESWILNLESLESYRFWLPDRVTRLTGMVVLNSTSISHRTILSHQCKCIWPQPVGTQFVSILTFTTMEKFASRCSTPGTADRKRNGIHTHQVSFKSLCLSNHWFSFRSPTLTSLVMRDHVEPRQEIRIRVTMTSISDRPPSSGLCWSRFAIRLRALNRFVLLVFFFTVFLLAVINSVFF